MRAYAACQCDPLVHECERLLPRLHPQAKLTALRSCLRHQCCPAPGDCRQLRIHGRGLS